MTAKTNWLNGQNVSATDMNNLGTEVNAAQSAAAGASSAAAAASSAVAGKYTKLSDGIPKSDLAAAVQTSLGLADTAYQAPAVVAAGADAAAARAAIGAGTGNSNLAIGTSGSTAAAGNDSRLSDQRTPLDGSVTSAKIVDGSVTLTDLATSVQTSLGKADSALQSYTPADGSIAKVKLASAVQTSLGLADSSLQAGTSADNLVDGTTNKAFLAAERTKLTGIASGATANSTDAQLRDRSTHTGSDTLLDTGWTLQDATDTTKQAQFNVPTGQTTGTTRVHTLPTVSTQLVGTDTADGLSNKRIIPRAIAVTLSATPTPNGDTTDLAAITSLNTNANIAAPTGTPSGSGQVLLFRITDDGTARTLAWNAIYNFSTKWPAPASTVVGLTTYVNFVWNAITSKFDCTYHNAVNPRVVEFTNAAGATFTALTAQPTPVGIIGARITAIPGGPGGGSGRRGAAGTVRGGGAGAGGGGVVRDLFIPASAIGASWGLTNTGGGTGGAARTTNDTDGAAGNFGQPWIFTTAAGATIRSYPGGGGPGGSTGAVAGGTSGGGFQGGTVGAVPSATGGVSASTPDNFAFGLPGGGAGGGITAADVASNGSRGGANYTQNSGGYGTAGVVGGASPTGGTDPLVAGLTGQGPGGGAASITGAAQDGANGVGYGAPGAGGGASLNGNNSGKGGNGGPAYFRIEWVYA